MEKLKYKLPSYSVINHLCLGSDIIHELKKCIEQLDSEFQSVIEINKELCGIHHELANGVYDNFYQISLTDSNVDNRDVTLEDCEIIHNDLHSSSRSKNIKRKKQISLSGGVMDESTYTRKTAIYEKYQNLFDKILFKFKGQPTRVRLVKLMSGTTVPPHIDYDPSYALRFIFPIVSDKDCINIFWVKDKIEVVNFEPGNAYFLNTGFKHAVLNFSKKHRYTFMVSVKGTEDIDHLLKK